MDNQRDIETPAARKFRLSRGLPKSGQVTSYVARDDGDLELGWWKGRLNANNKARYRLVTIAGDDVVTDLATGLMWAAVGNAAGCLNGTTVPWVAAIGYTATLDFAGFDDWRIPNVKELISIVEYDAALFVGAEPLIQEPPFSNTVRDSYWTSTTRPPNTSEAFRVNFLNGHITGDLKTNVQYLRCVRKGI